MTIIRRTWVGAMGIDVVVGPEKSAHGGRLRDRLAGQTLLRLRDNLRPLGHAITIDLLNDGEEGTGCPALFFSRETIWSARNILPSFRRARTVRRAGSP